MSKGFERWSSFCEHMPPAQSSSVFMTQAHGFLKRLEKVRCVLAVPLTLASLKVGARAVCGR